MKYLISLLSVSLFHKLFTSRRLYFDNFTWKHSRKPILSIKISRLRDYYLLLSLIFMFLVITRAFYFNVNHWLELYTLRTVALVSCDESGATPEPNVATAIESAAPRYRNRLSTSWYWRSRKDESDVPRMSRRRFFSPCKRRLRMSDIAPSLGTSHGGSKSEKCKKTLRFSTLFRQISETCLSPNLLL